MLVAIKSFIGKEKSKILAIMPNASASVGMRKNIHAKLTSKNVMIIFTDFPNLP